MKKSERQQQIRELLTKNDVQTQEDLVTCLHKNGIQVTQATVSRDIRDMQLIKLPSKNGGYHYALPPKKDENIKLRLARTLKESVKKMTSNATFIFLELQPGSGPVIASLLNQLNSDDILGAISDDGSVLIVTKSAEGVTNIKQLITDMRAE
ncbi:Arginine pathway regulatory protein ArgR, repressor of arg regulon [Pediococcus damnosus]|uniref:Arginine repressor n=1 Tax=Pediococcus damnosus TaxID=51663 RepID=A0A0R2HE72_9LACO|nr:ArgR family transcriptional regulator [Pediococcus damnosus]AMV61414.1 Arginine pathway regulatory protein ArgR, repressor of arg regulon [Pediococcus damnosus]AMV62228.1 Arginine pathway regulatory protein ArgR, repressor of arg regulon [Pediococcus damnosus]AMV65776.1 Arginine pathway regulatory protein ArgR, repressor of arg regulon [Pediococcus damnosus]AMV67915.1 Arginine pathway regulatory protein ArgR, repressor of arg regulon [Pediococcus damnosus]AMV70113.1 Arginine pathway regulat